MSTGVFPDQFKNCSVHPLLKKSNPDKKNLSNYRPINYLTYLTYPNSQNDLLKTDLLTISMKTTSWTLSSLCVCEYFISRRLHDGDDRRHKQKSSFIQQGIKLCDYSYLKICSIFVKVFVHYNLCIFIILIYSRVMRMHSYFIHTHIFTQTFTQSCIRACASLSQLFEFIIKMDSPVLSHILKLFFLVVTSLLPFIPTYLPSSSFLPFLLHLSSVPILSRSFLYLRFTRLEFFS